MITLAHKNIHKLQKHKMTHTGEKAHKCYQCLPCVQVHAPRGAPQDGDPNQAQASVTDAGSGSGTPASERAQVKVAGVHWFSCTPSSIAKMWVRTLIMLILTVGLIVLLLIFGNQLGLLKLK